MQKSLGIGALGAAVAIMVACSSNKPAVTVAVNADAGAPPPSNNGGLGFLSGADAGAMGPAPTATGPVFFTDAGGAAPTPTGPTPLGDQALDGAIDLAIGASATKLAPQMNRDGQTGRATLKEGEHFAMVVTLLPNTCYTFIGFSPPGQVDKLEMKLYGLPLNLQAGASGPNDKATPVMGQGKAAICPILPVGVPYKIDAAAAKGSGRIGIQVFARPR